MAPFERDPRRLKGTVSTSDGWWSKHTQTDNILPGQMQKRGQKDNGPVCGLFGSSATRITKRLNRALMTAGLDPSVMTHLA